MALARTKTWSSGEVLTAAELNAEFNSILNNARDLISPLTGALDMDGNSIVLDAAAATSVVSSAAVSWNFTSGAKTGTPATTGSIANWSAQTFTDSATAGSGTATAFVAHAIQRPTLAATNATVTTTNAATFYIANAPAAGTNETLTNAYALWIDDGRVRLDPSAAVVSAASATLDAVNITAQTVTISGSTNITTATGMNFVTIGQPTLSAASALTVTNAAALYISNAPTGGGAGPATITNAYALWVDAGDTRFDGNLLFTDNTTDIGASGATRPRDLFLARNAVIGGTLNVTGVPTIPTAAVDTNTTQAASTAFVLAQAATQVLQEAGTSIINFVTSGRQHFHQSSVKGWCKANFAAGDDGSYNLTSVTDTGTGIVTFTWNTAFSGVGYSANGAVQTDSALYSSVANTSFAAGTTQMRSYNDAGTATDGNQMHCQVMGDQ